jgi:hypothetical protein
MTYGRRVKNQLLARGQICRGQFRFALTFLRDLGGLPLRALRSKALNLQVREGSREGREENPEDLRIALLTLLFVFSAFTGDLKMPAIYLRGKL